MKTAISLPDPLFKAADRLARRLGISRSELFQRALSMLIEKHEGADVTAALNAVYRRPDVPRGIDPLLLEMQLASLPKEDW
ncbi:MAG TPA: ribbon-helix-helix protein, CopG family [Planctomycetota bacterium]|nr:ribbon-helix-helix protein, CopG family [Planctomycetota bacterium]